MPYPLNQIPKLRWEKERREEIQAAVRQNPNEKVFGIGLSRTGTTSLSRALSILGYETADWTHRGRVSGWSEFYTKDAVTDTPASLHFESLYFTFEASRFIYTTRDRADWTRSIANHLGASTPEALRISWQRDAYWTRNQNWAFYNAFKRAQIEKCLYVGHDTWEAAFEAYDDRVRTFFDDKPDNRLLTMDIPDGDEWDPLCSFLDVEVPDQPFPHENKSEYRR